MSDDKHAPTETVEQLASKALDSLDARKDEDVETVEHGEDDIVERWHAAVEAYQFQHLSDPWDFVKIGNQMADEIAHLRTRVEELEGALEEIAGPPAISGDAATHLRLAKNRARRALRGETDD